MPTNGVPIDGALVYEQPINAAPENSPQSNAASIPVSLASETDVPLPILPVPAASLPGQFETFALASLPEEIAEDLPVAITHANPPEAAPRTTPPEEPPQAYAVSLSSSVEPEVVEAALPPLRLDMPPVPEYIMGKGAIPPEEMAAFFVKSNPGVEAVYIEELINFYIEESAVEGVNPDVAFAQMCLETGFLRYGGLVTADMNNFCGLGAIGPVERGLSFPNPRIGVRAHIQHLKAYASEEPLKQVLVDPRFHYVKRGTSPAIAGLAGTWATDPLYAAKIGNILERLYSFYFEL